VVLSPLFLHLKQRDIVQAIPPPKLRDKFLPPEGGKPISLPPTSLESSLSLRVSQPGTLSRQIEDGSFSSWEFSGDRSLLPQETLGLF